MNPVIHCCLPPFPPSSQRFFFAPHPGSLGRISSEGGGEVASANSNGSQRGHFSKGIFFPFRAQNAQN